MRKHYYLLGSLYGVLVLLVMVFFLFSAPNLPVIWKDALAVISGCLATLSVSRVMDRKWPCFYPSFFKTIFGLVGTFLAGVLIGSLTNWAINGDLASPSFGWKKELWDWFGKPAYALSAYGFPCAVAVAVTYFAAWKFCLWVRER